MFQPVIRSAFFAGRKNTPPRVNSSTIEPVELHRNRVNKVGIGNAVALARRRSVDCKAVDPIRVVERNVQTTEIAVRIVVVPVSAIQVAGVPTASVLDNLSI